MSMREVIEGIERGMFERATERNCGNCKWHEDGMCACLKRGITGFTENDFCCEFHELKG